MESEKFDLVFKGQLLPKRTPEEVKVNLGALFKISAAQVDGLFTGKSVVLKRNIDLASANRYRIAIKNAGARVDLVKSGSVDTPKPAVQPTLAVAQHDNTEVKVQVAQPIDPVEAPTISFTLRDAEYLLAPEERKPDVVRDIDLSAFSLREGGNLVDAAEVERVEPVIVEELMAELMPAGSNLVDSSAKNQPAPKVKVLEADLAPVGARFAPEKKENAVAPNVDHLSLER